MALVLTIGLIAARLAPSRGVYTIAEVQVGLDLWWGAILLVRIPLVSQHRPTPQCAPPASTPAQDPKSACRTFVLSCGCDQSLTQPHRISPHDPYSRCKERLP